MTADSGNNSPAPQEGPPGVPGWVKGLAFGVVAVLVIVLLMMLIMGGNHGPGRHGG